MDIVKLSLIGIVGTLLIVSVRKERGEYATLLAIAVSVLLFGSILAKATSVLSFADRMFALIPVDARYLSLIVKMIGITYVAEFASDLCAEAGCSAIGRQIDLFARLSILVVSIPVLSVFLDSIESW
jgi:stage III sporulation protein AD